MGSREKRSLVEQCSDRCLKYPCSVCPCAELAFEKHDNFCDFARFTEAELDEYLKLFNAKEDDGLRRMTQHYLHELARSNERQARNASEPKPAESTPDNVNHPQHYELPGGIECIDVLVATQGKEAVQAFCVCNAMKHLYRHKRKNGVEDVRKARWHLNKYIELEETNESNH